jgi:hypothetical protein
MTAAGGPGFTITSITASDGSAVDPNALARAFARPASPASAAGGKQRDREAHTSQRRNGFGRGGGSGGGKGRGRPKPEGAEAATASQTAADTGDSA